MSKDDEAARDPNKQIGLQLRMKEGLRARIEQAAKVSGGSMNGEIVERLERSLELEQTYGGSMMQHVLHGVALNVRRLEKKRGASWLEDRTVAHAAARIASDQFIYTSPMANAEGAEEASNQVQSQLDQMAPKCGFLQEVGAVKPIEKGLAAYRLNNQNALAPQPPTSEGAVNMPDVQFAPLVAYLLQRKLRLAVNPDQPSGEWPLERDGESLADAEKAGAKAVLFSLVAMVEDLSCLHDAFIQALQPEKDAEAEGVKLADSLTGVKLPHAFGDLS